MGNTLKMEKREILNQLFDRGWSDRKINKATAINRRTISKYRRRYYTDKAPAKISDISAEDRIATCTGGLDSGQNTPLSGTNKCPPTKVVHFPARKSGGEVSTDSQSKISKGSKSKVAIHTPGAFIRICM